MASTPQERAAALAEENEKLRQELVAEERVTDDVNAEARARLEEERQKQENARLKAQLEAKRAANQRLKEATGVSPRTAAANVRSEARQRAEEAGNLTSQPAPGEVPDEPVVVSEQSAQADKNKKEGGN